jgi:cellobiose-specific phosphotransferase system component IIA
MMTISIKTIHTVGIVTAVSFGVSLLTVTNIAPFASASPAATTNQTGNQTDANITTTAGGGGDQATATKQLDQAMKALESGDNAAAEGYMKEADNTLSDGEAKTHLSEAMKALQAGDNEGAKTHTQFAIDNL